MASDSRSRKDACWNERRKTQRGGTMRAHSCRNGHPRRAKYGLPTRAATTVCSAHASWHQASQPRLAQFMAAGCACAFTLRWCTHPTISPQKNYPGHASMRHAPPPSSQLTQLTRPDSRKQVTPVKYKTMSRSCRFYSNANSCHSWVLAPLSASRYGLGFSLLFSGSRRGRPLSTSTCGLHRLPSKNHSRSSPLPSA